MTRHKTQGNPASNSAGYCKLFYVHYILMLGVRIETSLFNLLFEGGTPVALSLHFGEFEIGQILLGSFRMGCPVVHGLHYDMYFITLPLVWTQFYSHDRAIPHCGVYSSRSFGVTSSPVRERSALMKASSVSSRSAATSLAFR